MFGKQDLTRCTEEVVNTWECLKILEMDYFGMSGKLRAGTNEIVLRIEGFGVWDFDLGFGFVYLFRFGFGISCYLPPF